MHVQCVPCTWWLYTDTWWLFTGTCRLYTTHLVAVLAVQGEVGFAVVGGHLNYVQIGTQFLGLQERREGRGLACSCLV